MFDTISKGFRAARERLTGQGELTEDVIDGALKGRAHELARGGCRVPGSQAVSLADVKDRALGEQVKLVAKTGDGKVRVRAEDHFVRICNEALVELMGPVDTELELANKGVTGVMMVGLQGSGKTTSTAKLARYLQKQDKKVMLVAADVYRPGCHPSARGARQAARASGVFETRGRSRRHLCRRH